MKASGQRLGEVQIWERLDVVDRWRESALPMRVWTRSYGDLRGRVKMGWPHAYLRIMKVGCQMLCHVVGVAKPLQH